MALPASGFTVIELVITVALVAILSTIALPLAEVTMQRAREQELRSALRQMREAIDAYKQAADEGRVAKSAIEPGYPKSLESLAAGVENLTDLKKAKIYFLRRVPRDPMASDSALAPAQTWGTRSYKSPLDDPKPGDDVYDVYSLSAGVGLNGIRYRDW